jgi:hypothetical protein
MSRAGKFIPGGAGRKTGAIDTGNRTGPIRAPDANAPEAEKGGMKIFPKGASLRKPVSKNQRLPIMLMSGGVCTLILSIALYYFAVLPAKRLAETYRQQMLSAQADLTKAQADEKARQEALLKQTENARATITVNTKPDGATVSIGDFHQKAPASFNVIPGKITITIQADGYRDYKQDATVTADTPTDLGVIPLVPQSGNLELTSPESDVTYLLTGPNDYNHQGVFPEKLQNLTPGDYQLVVSQHDWKLPPETITIHDQDNLQKAIKFPSADATITSVPPGATIRNGHIVLGQTPLSLSHLHPGPLNLTADLTPFALERFTLTVPDSGRVTKALTLHPDKTFVGASGITMIWIPEGNFWAGKYEVTQNQFEAVVAYNPSTFRRPNRPVETISWDKATDFCAKLTQFESKAGRLPEGYHYTLPTESQWSIFSADADINQAVMSRTESLSATQDVGSSEPNKYGIYDTLGNVWEWCQDMYDDKGNHSLRGGSWLSSPDNFPSAETRQAGGPKYADRFTGFRVVLVPN